MINTLYSAIWFDGFPFDSLTSQVRVANEPIDLEDTDSILVVWGGADINPALYNHPQSVTTYPGGQRDRIEWGLMKEAVRKGIPIIGVCRGAQMLCALAGGYLIQDVSGHHAHHSIRTIDGKLLSVNSIHHQMMEPSMTDHELIAWAEHPRSERYIFKDDQVWTPPTGWREPEFVYFREVNGFAIQWHPEMMRQDAPATEYVLSQIKEKLCLTV